MKLRTLIIDDEPPARKKIKTFLKDEFRVEVIGEAGNGFDAVELIEKQRPDLILLDIQMPKMNGFEVLEAISDMPYVIFTTAYDQYALKAFDVRAIDYLLKPFDQERFKEAIDRAVEQFGHKKDFQAKIDDLLGEIRGQQKHLQRILLKSAGKIFFVKTEEIQWIEADEKYAKLHLGKEAHLYRETMNALEKKLDAAKFIRCHRSAIVNIDFVSELHAVSHGDYAIVLKDGTRLNLGRNYRERFMGFFEGTAK